MNRVGILTFHSANNFGALLQAVSLQKTIIERGNVECELIDYKPEFIRKDYSISPFKNMHPRNKKVCQITIASKAMFCFRQ